MRELSLNDACGENPFATSENACSVVGLISLGLADLVNSGVAAKVIRLAKPVTETQLAEGLSLFDAMIRLSKNQETRDQGVFLQSLVQKVPLEDDLEAHEFEGIAAWDLKDHPGCIGLLLCAISDRLAVSATECKDWHSDILSVEIKSDDGGATAKELRQVGNIFSNDTKNLKRHCIETMCALKTPDELWQSKEVMFPSLLFTPALQQNLRSLGATQFKAAAYKLRQLNDSAERWDGRPKYNLDVRPESVSTMNKYGTLRQFRDGNGVTQTYELHVTVTDGFRAHFREIPEERKIEVAYIGPHLRVAKRN